MDSDTSRSPKPGTRSNDASPPGTRNDRAAEPANAEPAANALTLRREVLYPLRQNTGVGVMLVASAAMFFAVASSAFILRAQMPISEHCPAVAAPQPLVEAVEVELIEFRTMDRVPAIGNTDLDIDALPCAEPVFQNPENGPSSIIFRVCDTTF